MNATSNILEHRDKETLRLGLESCIVQYLANSRDVRVEFVREQLSLDGEDSSTRDESVASRL